MPGIHHGQVFQVSHMVHPGQKLQEFQGNQVVHKVQGGLRFELVLDTWITYRWSMNRNKDNYLDILRTDFYLVTFFSFSWKNENQGSFFIFSCTSCNHAFSHLRNKPPAWIKRRLLFWLYGPGTSWTQKNKAHCARWKIKIILHLQDALELPVLFLLQCLADAIGNYLFLSSFYLLE